MRIFVDLDGVLPVFLNSTPRQRASEKYWRELPAQQEVIDALKYVMETWERHGNSFYDRTSLEFYILSKYPHNNARKGKEKWIEKHLPFFKKENIILLPYEMAKEVLIRPINTDLLLDDYSPNLVTWESFGGKAVKVMNGINGTNGTWKGDKIDAFDKELIIDYLFKKIEEMRWLESANKLRLTLPANWKDATDEELVEILKRDYINTLLLKRASI